MTQRASLVGAIALALGTASTAAAQAPVRACVTPAEAESLVLAVAPDLIRQTGVACATALPPTALIRQTDSRLLGRYQAEADGAWTRASGALAKIAGPEAEAFIQSGSARTLIGALVAPAITGKIQPSDCPAIERVVTLLEPLPPKNTAALLVTAIQLSDADRSKRPGAKPSGLPICPAVTK